MRPIFALLACAIALFAQTPASAPSGAAAVREKYTKYEFEIPMRDGIKLFTAVYMPKDAAKGPYPILLQRTPYSVGPYGVDHYRASLGPSEHFQKAGYIVAYQDVRGRYLSQGTWAEVRPHNPAKGPRDTDESTDTYDTIDWLIKNVRNNNGKVGMWGISYPGFYVSAGMIDAHPALAAASPQAPVTDYYLGDDSYHNGAFMLAANFGFYQSFVERKGDPAPPAPTVPFQFKTPDGYDFYLRMGGLGNAAEKYFQNAHPYWKENTENTTLNAYWKARGIWRHLRGIKPAVMTVGGWFDAEDAQGPLRTHAFMEKNAPPKTNLLVMGPWTHGSWSRGDGDTVGNLHFGSKTAAFYREFIEFPFFEQQLKGKGDVKVPRAWVFATGRNEWRQFDAWPPAEAQPKPLYLAAGGRLAWQPDAATGSDEYLSDPNKPVPYLGYTVLGMARDYMTEDQRFASQRPDVLTFETDPLQEDLTIAGPIDVSLLVSTSGTDSDFVVKLIDVYPGDYPTLIEKSPTKMGGYQQLVRGEPFRGKFRKSFETPVPFVPNQPDRVEFSMPDVYHTFRKGHRLLVHVQSSWFPLTDRNPQKFMDIPRALAPDFTKATQRVFRGGAAGSRLTLRVLPGPM
jgi:putative CocE/NonD family hydrolase